MQNLISNKPTSFLTHKSLNSGESIVTSTGAISVNTGACTGRSPDAKKYVKDKTSLAFDKDRTKFIEPIEFEQLKMEILHMLGSIVRMCSPTMTPKIDFIYEHILLQPGNQFL